MEKNSSKGSDGLFWALTFFNIQTLRLIFAPTPYSFFWPKQLGGGGGKELWFYVFCTAGPADTFQSHEYKATSSSSSIVKLTDKVTLADDDNSRLEYQFDDHRDRRRES